MDNNATTASTGAPTPESTADARLENITVSEVNGTTRVEYNPTDISLDSQEQGGNAGTADNNNQEDSNANTQGNADQQTQGSEDTTEGAVQAEVTKQLETEKEVKADLASKGVDFDKLAKEYEQTGELSKQSMELLEKANYPKAVVDAYLEGLNARAERFATTVKGYAGGDADYAKMQTFIQSQGQEYIDGFNAAINSGNLAQIKLTISGIKAEMTKAQGTANPTIMANRAVGSTPQGYTSMAEMTKDMNDPRYNVDPVFTREVYAKVKAATIF